jgi:aromatic ring-opening dioxygenase catalytic subunit (LigB family)
VISGSGTGARAALADSLIRIVSDALDTAQPSLASTARATRFALDELRAMALLAGGGQVHALATINLEELARAAGLPEIEALDFRRGADQTLTLGEAEDWARIERFAALVAAACSAPQQPITSTSTAGAGPARAS